MQTYILLYILSGLGLSLCDRVHLYFNILWQRDSAFFGQSWTVPLLLGGASIAMLFGYRGMTKLMGSPPRAASSKRMVLSLLFLAVAYCITGPLGQYKIPLALGLFLTWMARLPFDRTRIEILTCLLIGLLGPLSEAAISATGNFGYYQPDILGVPLWLTGIYLHGGFAVCDIEAHIQRKRG